MTRRLPITMLTVLGTLYTSGITHAQPTSVATAASPHGGTVGSGLTVAARVNGADILLAECYRYLNRFPFISDENREQHTSWALQALIERQIVLDYLRQRMDLLKPGEVAAALERRRQLLARRGQLLETACADAGINEDVLARGIAWNLLWSRYVTKQLTPDRLRSYFAKHAADFDGRQLQVAQILWSHDATTDDPQVLEAKLQQARRVLADIRAGTITFAAAARQYSQGPSATRDGDLGWIERDGPMTERFSRAAFALDAEQVSEPVTDQFGVHLIHCQAIKPGRRSLTDVRFEVGRAARRELFEAIVRRARGRAEIEYTGAVPPYSEEQDVPLMADQEAAAASAEELGSD